MLYFIKGFHMREFGFPRRRDENGSQIKTHKWKKTNFITDLPKHSPISRYLVAKAKEPNKKGIFCMHASCLYQGNSFCLMMVEYDDNYKNPSVLKKLKERGLKLMEKDVNYDPRFERIILCHVVEKTDGESSESEERKSRSRHQQMESDNESMDLTCNEGLSAISHSPKKNLHKKRGPKPHKLQVM